MAATATDTPTDPELDLTAWDLEQLVDGEGPAGVERRLEQALAQAKTFAERYAGKLGELDSAGSRAGDGGAGRDPRPRRPRGLLRGARLLHDTADPARGALLQRTQERGTEIETTLLFFELEWAALARRAGAGAAGEEGRTMTGSWRGRSRLLPPPPAQRAPLSRAPALRARGEDPRREVPDRRLGLVAPVRGADLGDRGRAACGRPGDGGRTGTERVALDLALSRLALPDRELRRTTAEAVSAALQPGSAHARVPVQHAARR